MTENPLTIHVAPRESLPVEADPFESAKAYAKAAKAPATLRAYRADLAVFSAWCEAQERSPLPAAPETVCAFLAAQADDAATLSIATIARRCAAISYAHKLAGHETPIAAEIVRTTLAGIRRTLGPARPRRRKLPVTAERMRRLAADIPATKLKGLRDRALLLVGFAAALRRSELVALCVEDIEETVEGMRLTIRHSKTDQEGEGQVVAVMRGGAACPVSALITWIDAAGISEGPIFRAVSRGGRIGGQLRAHAVPHILKGYAEALGLDPSAISAHSLRSGFLTSAAARGASIWKLMDVSRHRSMDSLKDYVREAELFRDHAGTGLL